MATISGLLKIVGLFSKRALLKRQYSAEETSNFKEPINRSHPISPRVQSKIESLCYYVIKNVSLHRVYPGILQRDFQFLIRTASLYRIYPNTLQEGLPELSQIDRAFAY